MWISSLQALPWGSVPIRQGLDDGDHSGDLVGLTGALGTRTSGLPTDVEDVRTLGKQVPGVTNGNLRIGPQPSIGEGVRGDVHHTHDKGASGVWIGGSGINGQHDSSV